MRVRAFVQARMSSARFPGKVLAPFRGRPILWHVVDRVARALPDVPRVIVTSTDASDDPIAAYAQAIDTACFRGPLDDVFELDVSGRRVVTGSEGLDGVLVEIRSAGISVLGTPGVSGAVELQVPGALGIRVARQLEEPATEPLIFTDEQGNPTKVPVLDNTGVNGVYLSSEGKRGEKEAWGTRAKWMTLSGNIKGDDVVIGMVIVNEQFTSSTLFTVTENGFGKRTELSEYRRQSRGGKGLINLRLTAKTGSVVGVRQVFDEDNIMVMSDQGNLVRLRVADIPRIGRHTQGVRLINLASEQRLVGVARIEEENGRLAVDLLEQPAEQAVVHQAQRLSLRVAVAEQGAAYHAVAEDQLHLLLAPFRCDQLRGRLLLVRLERPAHADPTHLVPDQVERLEQVLALGLGHLRLQPGSATGAEGDAAGRVPAADPPEADGYRGGDRV